MIIFKTLSGLIFLIGLALLVSECLLRLFTKYNTRFSRFSSFLRFIYKQKAEEGFPHGEISNNFYYYKYHPFCNFAPKPSGELKLRNGEINSLGFRGSEKDWDNLANYYVYLSGDCQFFDAHLKLTDTFAYMLEANLNRNYEQEIVTLNAGCLHYTLLHCLNRLIVDLNKIRLHSVILSVGANDVLVFVHSKDGKASPDYTNLFKAFNEELLIADFQNSLFIYYSKILQLYKYLRKRKMFSFDNAIETISPGYNSNENVSCAREIFRTNYFENYLRMYIGICNMFHLPLILTTINYNPPDMRSPVRAFVAYGIDQMNLIIKKLAQEYSLPVFDYQKEFTPTPSRIFNKWHYTKEGNILRAELFSNFIQRLGCLETKMKVNTG